MMLMGALFYAAGDVYRGEWEGGAPHGHPRPTPAPRCTLIAARHSIAVLLPLTAPQPLIVLPPHYSTLPYRAAPPYQARA